MKINKRLKAIGDLVSANSFCLDVGCDHAFLDIYLVKKNIGIKAIASDVLIGPLNQARQNIKNEGLEDEIEVRLGDGLDTYSEEVDTIIISGMGGRNMIGILQNNLDVLSKIKAIVISPNNYQEDVKRFLCKNGFIIDDEIMIKEGKYIYQIIKFIKGSKKYSKKEYFFGPVFLKKRNTLFYEYYERERESLEKIVRLLPEEHKEEIKNIKEKIALLKEELE